MESGTLRITGKLVTFLLLAAFLGLAIYVGAPLAKYALSAFREARRGEIWTLSTGQAVRVVFRGVVSAPDRVLRLTYRTHLQIAHDQPQLVKEVCEIWRDLKPTALRDGVSKVMIVPSKLKIGFREMRETSTIFEFTKGASGLWTCPRCECDLPADSGTMKSRRAESAT